MNIRQRLRRGAARVAGARATPALALGRRAMSGLFGGSPRVVVCAMPRSASSFVTTLLAHALRCPQRPLVTDYADTEQNLSLAPILDAWPQGFVAQHHFLPTAGNLRLVRQCGLRPVILHRDVRDVLVSLREVLVKRIHELDGEAWRHRTSALFIAPCGPEFAAWDEERQMDLLVDYAAPWLVRFYATWQRACACGLDAAWCGYGEVTADPAAALTRLGGALALGFDVSDVRRAVQAAASPRNFNVGRAGRGRGALTPAQERRLVRLGAYFPDAGCEAIGLGPAAGGAS